MAQSLFSTTPATCSTCSTCRRSRNAPARFAPHLPLPPGPFDLFLVDPPYRFQTRSERNQHKAPARKYATMTLAELAALPVASIAAENCFLVLWATQAQLPDGLALM